MIVPLDDPIPGALDVSDSIETVTSGAFNDLVVKGNGPIAVEFMSYGCSHCRAIEPALQRVAEMVKSREKIVRVDVGVDQELANIYKVRATPTLVMFLNGKQVGRVEGPSPTVSSVLTAVTQPFQP